MRIGAPGSEDEVAGGAEGFAPAFAFAFEPTVGAPAREHPSVVLAIVSARRSIRTRAASFRGVNAAGLLIFWVLPKSGSVSRILFPPKRATVIHLGRRL